MSYLFKIEGKKVYPNEETLMIPPFNVIWNRDTSRDKHVAMCEFAYIEFMTSQLRTNPYRGYQEERKEQIIINDLFGSSRWKPDDIVKEAMKKIDDFQKEGSPAYSLYISSLVCCRNLESALRNMSVYSEENRKADGTLILKPADITKALKDTHDVIESMSKLNEKIQQDLFEAKKIRGGKTISPFAKIDD